MVVPFIYYASCESNHKISLATSLAVPNLPWGIEFIKFLFLIFCNLVEITPGETHKTLIFFSTNSLDRPIVKFSIAALVGA